MREFELSIYEHFGVDQLKLLIGQFFNIRFEKIDNSSIFFNNIGGDNPLDAGLEIIHLDDQYKTLLRVYTRVEYGNSSELLFALLIAEKCKAKVAVGDITEESDFIVITSELEIFLGYDADLEEGFGIELGRKIASSSKEIKDLLTKIDC